MGVLYAEDDDRCVASRCRAESAVVYLGGAPLCALHFARLCAWHEHLGRVEPRPVGVENRIRWQASNGRQFADAASAIRCELGLARRTR